MQAKVVESESEVPLAMAQAFREGKLGVFDYVNMRNIQADTSMRQSISNTETDELDDNDQKLDE